MMVGDGDEVEEDASDNADELLQQASGSWVLCIINFEISMHVYWP